MFRRGQKIIITKSSAANNGHPNVGDIGYLNSVFVYPFYKLILVEIMLIYYVQSQII